MIDAAAVLDDPDPDQLDQLDDEQRDQLARDLADHLDAPAQHLRGELDLLARRAQDTDAARAHGGVSCVNGGKYGTPQHNNESTRKGGSVGVENTAVVARPVEGHDWREDFTDHDHPDGVRKRNRGQALQRADLARFLFTEEGLGAGAIAQRIGVGVKDVYEVLEPLLDVDDDLGHVDLLDETADDRAALPIPLDADDESEGGALYMAGSQPPRDANCLRRHVLQCEACEDRRAEGRRIPNPDKAPGTWDADRAVEPDDYVQWPHGWARMERPAGCEWPACRTCKTVWVPTRAAAAAIRVEQARAHHERNGEDVDLRHVVLSPPSGSEDAQLDTVADVREIYDTAREILERKGALGWALVLHPWRGTPDNWRQSPHVHAIAAFPAEGPEHGPRPEKAGGAACCRHAPEDANPDQACCDGSCSRGWCVAAREQRACDDVQAACGRIGLAAANDDPPAEAEARAALEAAQKRRDEARARACDRGWVFRVIEDGNGNPRDVCQGPHDLQGGRREGVIVDAGVLDLFMYELDHAGVLVDEQDRTIGHTLRWGGAWSYNALGLRDDLAEVADHYTEGEDARLTCPACTGTQWRPIVDDIERAGEIHRRLADDQERAALEARWAIAREQLGVDDEPTGEPPDRGGTWPSGCLS